MSAHAEESTGSITSTSCLPSELVLLCLSFTNPPTITSFRQCSRSSNDLIDSSTEQLHKLLAANLGYTSETTCSASTAIERFSADSETAENEEISLQKAIRFQRTIDGSFDGVTTWTEFVRRRFLVDRNWRKGKFVENWIKLKFPRGIVAATHRFKIDPELPGFVVSGREGGNFGFDPRGEMIWQTISPDHLYPHVELSEGYLIQAIPRPGTTVFAIWRRKDISEPAWRNHPDFERFEDAVKILSRTERGYKIFTIIELPARVSATKFRFPYILAADPSSHRIFRFSIFQPETAKIGLNPSGIQSPTNIDSIDLSGHWSDADIRYVEMAGKFCFIATATAFGLVCWDTAKNKLIDFPLDDVRGVCQHHDGENLVSVVDSDLCEYLIWTPDWKLAVARNSAQFAEQTQKFRINKNFRVTQLAVENGRCAFIAISRQGEEDECGLWYFTIENGNPSVPVCIAFPLPCVDPPERLEMTSTAIYVPACSAFQPATHDTAEGRLRSVITNYNQADFKVNVFTSKWEKCLASWEKEDDCEADLTPPELWAQFDHLVPALTVMEAENNSFLVYSFAQI